MAGSVTDDWLKTFNDPTLDGIVAEAIANNLELRQKAAQVEAARQAVRLVGSQLWPQIGAQVGAATLRDSSQTANANSNLEYLGISWEADLWGRLRAQKSAALAEYQATALDYAFARQSLAATTAKSWYLATQTRQLVSLAEDSVRIYMEVLELVRIRREAGRVADFDVAQANAALATERSQLSGAEGRYSDARRALELLLGRYPAAEISVNAAFVPVPPPVGAGLPSALLERRPDIQEAERQVLAAFRIKEAARLARLPSISLGFEGGHLSDRILDLFGLNPWIYRAAVGMAAPIFTGGALEARVKIATAEEAQATAWYGSVILRAFGEVETALTYERLLSEQLQYAEQSLGDRLESVRIARERYAVGSGDLLSLLILQGEELTTRNNVVRLSNARLANRINLHLALGGSFDATPAIP